MRYCLAVLVLMMTWTVSLSGQSYHGWCTQGGTNPVTTGVPASQPFIRSFPNCTIGVTSVATGMPATLTDLTGASLPNPFMNSASGNTMTGDYSFVITSGPGAYNVQISAPGLTTYTFRINIGGTTVDCSTFAPPTGGAKLAACIAALPATGGIADATNILGPQTITADIFAGNTKPVTLLLGAATYTITAGQTLPSNSSAIRCQGTTFVQQTGANVPIWAITGADDIFENCIINAQTPIAGANLYVLTFNGSNRALVRNNTINNLAGYGFYTGGSTTLRIINNSIFGLASTMAGPNGIQTAGGNVQDLLIEGNRIDVPGGVAGGEPIQLSTSSTSDVGRVMVRNNSLSTGIAFCLEAAAFGGGTSTVHDITITGNTCRITGSTSVHGGFSIGVVKNVIVSDNLYDGGGFTTDIGAVEIAGSSQFSVTGNTIENAANGNGCFALNGATDNGSVMGNSCDGYSGTGIYIGTSQANGLHQKVTIGNNTIVLTAASMHPAIFAQCNFSSAVCHNIVITGNVIYGVGIAASTAIQVEQDAGIMDNIVISGNSIHQTGQGISSQNANNVSITNNIYDAANSAASFAIVLNGGNNVNIGGNTITSLNAGVQAYTIGVGIQVLNNSNVVIASNVVNGVNATDSGKAAIAYYNTTGTTQQAAITGNTINMHGPGNGVLLSCAGTVCTDVSVNNNSLIGDATPGSLGVSTGGTIQRASISNNNIQNFAGCYGVVATVSGRITNNTISACTPVGTNTWGGIQFIDYNGFTSLYVPAMLANGSILYITDYTIANPCAGGGTGAILKRLNGINVCN